MANCKEMVGSIFCDVQKEFTSVVDQPKQDFNEQDFNNLEVSEQDITCVMRGVESSVCGVSRRDKEDGLQDDFVEITEEDLVDIQSFDIVSWHDVVDEHIPDEEGSI